MVFNFSDLVFTDDHVAFTFDPAVDVLHFDDASILPTTLDYNVSGLNSVLTITSGPNAGKVIQLNSAFPFELCSTNVTFLSGKLVLGDDSPSTGDDAAQTVNGGAAGDVLMGFGGNDTLNGNGGNDQIWLTPGLSNTYGTDVVNGGTGNDTVVMTTTGSTGVEANLATGELSAGDNGSGSATLSSIENLWGTDQIDTIRGSSVKNVLKGLGGDDSLFGGDGADRLEGGEGADGANYSGDPAAVNVTLATGSAVDGYGATDRLISIENATGSSSNDTLTGNNQANTLRGGPGNDQIDGGAGNDVLSGDDGTDTLVGGIGNDLCFVDVGDVVAGDPGNDTVSSSYSWTLATGLENLELQDVLFAVDGRGNNAANFIYGNSEGNYLQG